MVLFDLNNVRGAAVTATPGYHHSSNLHGDALAPANALKSVKRLTSHPWPFSVKFSARSGSGQHPDFRESSQGASSFVT
ncbi:MAG: hypothetical protein V4625_07130 [Pseudomonadota bacterium]